ncbi:MAG: four helix bundle protein [Bacteroidetes bacterium]|nr:four helix bundle protein [Bacteroidota bacterium]
MQDLKARTFMFAVSVGKLIIDMPDSRVNKHYFAQIVRCSSSVGANYRAARRAKSNADFINKLKIVEEECDESIYFLELLAEFNLTYKEQLKTLINEGTEILKIIVTSITTTRNKINN